MKAGARLYIDLPDKQWDLVAPSVEPLMGFTSRLISGWVVSELLDLMEFRGSILLMWVLVLVRGEYSWQLVIQA